ncbi:2-iminobutanoate/2-iminopropanoate deaminase [Cichlidogyrus casuarinus]|uniref:2-iminobutanoate/2-iminopropanoate deaminase n=1 Tax=Cichlidogyrus casuarinus TaxID=1844966 RepID=A0ABD2QLH1_9PLAT
MLYKICSKATCQKILQFMKRFITSLKAPKPLGPYSPGVEIQAQKRLYLSGQLGMNPETLELVPGGVEAEAKKALDHVRTLLAEAGYEMTDVAAATVLLADMEDFAKFNEIYKTYFQDPGPTRTCFQAARLPKNARVEITVIAEK